MSNKLNKIQKNADDFLIKRMCINMTPEDYQKALETATRTIKSDLNKTYSEKYKRLVAQCEEVQKQNIFLTMNTISVELLYELANQMNYWKMKEETEEDKFIKDSARIRIQEIFQNTMQSIEKYAYMKNENQASKSFNAKKKKIEKEFKIKF